MNNKWTDESYVDDFVKEKFKILGLEKGQDYNEKNGYSAYLKDALQGGSKTNKKSGSGIPDFTIEKYKIPVIIENKFGLKNFIYMKNKEIILDDKSISRFAVNGAIHYAQCIISSEKYKEAIAIGIAGESQKDIRIQVYYVFGSSRFSYKLTQNVTFDFLESKNSFDIFYKDAILTEQEKHSLIIKTQTFLQEHAKKLNKLMHNHNITASQRVLYVSGMLLAMQDIKNKEGEMILPGLSIEDLKGIQTEGKRDGKLITEQIKEYLETKIKKLSYMGEEKLKLMLASFGEISKDPQRDEIQEDTNNELIANLLKEPSSINKQIFAYIYYYIFSAIQIEGYADIMGEMYSEFLKYALGDGKELGIVLTPPYVTKMMAEILELDEDCKVMDLAAGSAGFLISSMEVMIEKADKKYGKNTTKANKKIASIKKNQLLGIELNAEMFALAATNMILRGDGSSNIQKANTFRTPEFIYDDFKATRLLLNPPFTFEENGMPFIAFGLEKMQKGGLGAIIIQDSAGSGKATKSNQKILKQHTLKASIKMPPDLFQPMAGVQTSIYIFEAGIPHNFSKPVKFIDFRNDGFKRKKRNTEETDNPTQRYSDIIKIYQAGKIAEIDNSLWNIDEIYVEDFITDSGADWNFDQHQITDPSPKLEDFKKTIADYLSWQVSNILKKENTNMRKPICHHLEKLENTFKQSGGKWKEYKINDLFNIELSKGDNKANELPIGKIPLISAGENNNGIVKYINNGDGYAQIFPGNSITVDMFGNAFYQSENYYTVSHGRVNILIPKNSFKFNKHIALFIISQLKKLRKFYGFSYMLTSKRIGTNTLNLPIIDNQIAFDYMESYIRELEAERIRELEAYLNITGLKDYHLNTKEQQSLERERGGGQAELVWQKFQMNQLFKTSQQGVRLKQADHIPDNMPFVMSGILNTGISDFIGNKNVKKINSNSLTIEFGNVFYRDYEFGASDDVGVFWSNNKMIS